MSFFNMLSINIDIPTLLVITFIEKDRPVEETGRMTVGLFQVIVDGVLQYKVQSESIITITYPDYKQRFTFHELNGSALIDLIPDEYFL